MNRIIFFISFFLLIHFAKSQNLDSTDILARSLYVELLGNGIYYSINYDQIIDYHYNHLKGFRIGFEPYLPYKVNSGRIMLTGGIYRLYGKKNNFFEAGAGVSFFFGVDKARYTNIGPYLNLGYRKQGILGKPFFFRATFTPFITFSLINFSYNGLGVSGPWGGFSLGYTFQKKKIKRTITPPGNH